MIRKIYLILACLILSEACALGEEPNNIGKELNLTLGDTVFIAYQNNKDIQIQENELKVSRARILGARSEFIPKLNLNAGYTHNDAIFSFPIILNPKKDNGVVAGYKNDNQISANISETVYNGGANIANYKQALLGLRTSQETLRAKKLDVEFEAKRLYYGLLLAYETERIAEELVDQAQQHYADVEKKFAQGTSSRFDLLQSKVQVSKLMPQLVSAKNSVDLIMADLKKLMGLKMRDSISVSERLHYAWIEIKEDEFLQQAYLYKPEMILKSLGVDISKWSIEMGKAGWRPQINASAGYSYRSNDWLDMFNSRHNNWQAGVSVTVPIFDAWSTKAKVDEAKAKYAEAILDKDNLIDQIAVDVRQACLDLNKARAVINSQKDNIEEAREALRISIVSYDNGVGTNLDVLDSQVSLAQVEQNLAQGIYDYLMAQASLERTMGKSIFTEGKNEKKD
ncbi:MAG: TolC family protein [Candidatus Omnitrophica bacterium]|nr:TolC family protein [Candidatus Omnitrophota bacterium]MDD5237048.1 TolC family protein [Candidatus Omnitrophota bacterium]MDD5610667.1 TolC family protein [Candidatus Omnitrophota bacterium]